MCGYLGNLHDCPAVIELLQQLQIPLPYPQGRSYVRQSLDGLVTAVGDAHAVTPALWWYALQLERDRWVVNEKLTSFNARNLQAPLWRDALTQRRAVVFATEIGESEGRERYLMRSREGLALGALYRDWQAPSGEWVRSAAIITRPPHPHFSRYHSKSIPCFLPLDAELLRSWLDPHLPMPEAVERILAEPTLYSDLEVTRVKSYKHAEPLAETELLIKDVKERG